MKNRSVRVGWLCSTRRFVSRAASRAATARVWVACVASVACTACADDGGPRLAAVDPTAASANAQVVVTGSRLCGAAGDCTHAAAMLELGLSPPMIEPVITAYSATSITFLVPTTTPGKTAIEVTVDGRTSNSLDFEVLP